MQRATAIKVSSVFEEAISAVVAELGQLPGFQVIRVSDQQSDATKGIFWKYVDALVEVDGR